MEFYQRIGQFGKRGLLVALATMLAFSIPSCLGLTETGEYAKELNLPGETIAIVNQLNYETNTIALLNEISCLPKDVQINEQFLNYLKQITADKQVTDDELAESNDFDQDGLTNIDELQYDTDLFNADSDDDGVQDAEEVKYGTSPLEANPGLKQALDYLSTFPEKNLKEMIGLGLDSAVVDYLLLLSSLNDQDFAQYALENKLCFQDRNLTELEIKFLNQPDNYSKELFDSYMSEVNNINPELASELTKLPDFQEVDIKNMEVLEDLADLAKSESVFKTSFGSILNEGIKDQRKYCSPLEALVWILYDDDKEYINSELYYYEPLYAFPWDTHVVRIELALHTLVCFSWEKSSESNNFLSGRWEDFSEVTDRLNSPLLVALYMDSQLTYMLGYYRTTYTAYGTFNCKKAACMALANFGAYCLSENGHEAYQLRAGQINPRPKIIQGKHLDVRAHSVTLYRDGLFFYFIDGPFPEKLPRQATVSIRGPFNTIEDAAKRVCLDRQYLYEWHRLFEVDKWVPESLW